MKSLRAFVFLRRSLTAALVAASLGTVGLEAATIDYSATIAATDAAGSGSLPTSTSFSLPQFDPSLGTLTAVDLSFSLNYQGEVDVLNFTGALQSIASASSSIPIQLATPTPGIIDLVSATNTIGAETVGFSPPLNQFFGAALSATVPLSPSDLADYEGTGNGSFLLSYGIGSYSGTTGAPVGVFFGGDANSSGTATVTYTFNSVPTPEPSTLALLALGLIGLLALGRRLA
jgi:PEP-CTERM motif